MDAGVTFAAKSPFCLWWLCWISGERGDLHTKWVRQGQERPHEKMGGRQQRSRKVTAEDVGSQEQEKQEAGLVM